MLMEELVTLVPNALPNDLNPSDRKSLIVPFLWMQSPWHGLVSICKDITFLWLLLLHDHLKETPAKLDLFFHS